MFQLLLVVTAIVCVGLIITILLQHSKGSDVGAAFGSGVDGALFGPAGAASILTKITAWLGFIFLCLTLTIAWSQREERYESIDIDTSILPAIEETDGDDNGESIPFDESTE